MDTPKPTKPDHLLHDLESIRQLLEDDNLELPLLTETLDDDLQIPLLSDIIEPGPVVAQAVTPPPAPASVAPVTSAPLQVPPPASFVPQAAPATHTTSTISNAIQRSVGTQQLGELTRLDSELRAAAQLLLQDVIDDFVPQIEAELKRRLDARLDRLLAQRKP